MTRLLTLALAALAGYALGRVVEREKIRAEKMVRWADYGSLLHDPEWEHNRPLETFESEAE